MFNDRDLMVLGAGALLAVICLMLPFPFAWKVAVGMIVLIGFMVLALLRLGPDRVTPEEWLRRRFRYWQGTRRYVYHQDKDITAAPEILPPLAPTPAPAPPVLAIKSRKSNVLPVGLSFDEVGIYPLVTVFLTVIGVYFVFWIANGGGAEIARIFQ
ncbi:MAG: hypothetical protein ABIG63_04805 [Chloroflexota bacterium]